MNKKAKNKNKIIKKQRKKSGKPHQAIYRNGVTQYELVDIHTYQIPVA